MPGSASRSPVVRTEAPRTYPSTNDRLDRLGPLEQSRARLHGALGQQMIESLARHHEPERRERGELGPRQLDRGAARMDAQPDHPLEPRVVGVDAHVLDRLDRARGQPVAADLLAGERGLLDQGDVDPVSGQVIGGRRPARAGADHEHIGLDGSLHVHAPPRPGRRLRPGLVKLFTSSAYRTLRGTSGPQSSHVAGDPTWRPPRARLGGIPSTGTACGEPLEPLARQQRSVLVVPGRHRRAQVGMLGGQRLRRAVDPRARTAPASPGRDR